MQIALFAVLILLTYTVLSKNSFTFDEVAFVVLATLYIGVSFYYFIQIRGLYGMSAIFFAAVIIWSTDSGAYFIGKSMGKRKLWPEISPNKTVEGFIGGIVTAVVLSLVFQAVTGFLPSYLLVMFITLLLSIFGQLGDLVESALKRHYHVKDSGTILLAMAGFWTGLTAFIRSAVFILTARNVCQLTS